MAIIKTQQAASDEQHVRGKAPANGIAISLNQADLFLDALCTNYPRIPRQFRPRRPIHRQPIKPSAAAITFGRLEVQFRILGRTARSPGAVVEVLGYDWQ